MTSLINQFIDNVKLSTSEIELYENAKYKSSSCNHSIIRDQHEYSFLKKLLLSYLYLPLDDKCTYISTASNARSLILSIFKKNVKSNTLIITSAHEHNSVNEILHQYSSTNEIIYINGASCKFDAYLMFNQCKNKLDKIHNIEEVFIYFIGTIPGTGFIINSLFFNMLSTELSLKKIKYKMAIDAVQELFITPRDYSQFDYIIGTTHAFYPEVNTGILFSKDNNFQTIVQSTKYIIDALNMIQIRRNHLLFFSHIMNQHYSSVAQYLNLILTYESPHLFSIGNSNGTLTPLIQHVDDKFLNTKYQSIKFRGLHAIFDPQTFKNKMAKLDKFLNTLIMQQNNFNLLCK